MISPLWGRAAAACSLVLVVATARALPVVRKTPAGTWVTQAGPIFQVPAGQTIDWSVRVCSGPASPIVASVTDYLHSGECPGHEHQALLCPPLTVGDGVVAACDDLASPPLTQPALDVRDIHVDASQCTDVVFSARVALLTPPGTQLCNVAVYATDSADPNGSGQTTPPSGSGCTCVEVVPPLPTQMALTLTSTVDDPPFAAGDAQSTVVYSVTGTNGTPRAAEGRFVLPVPVGLELLEWLQCPPGATCSVTPSGEIEVSGLVIAEGATFTAGFRMRGACSGVAESRICAQGWFEPAEDPGARLLTDDPDSPGDTPTCFKPALPDIVLQKTWRLQDQDGDGVPTAGDRIRFQITAWNRGQATAREVWLRDSLPLGYEHAAPLVAVDPGGRYALPGTAQWDFPEIGPGSVVEAWVETAMMVDAVAPNRAQLSTRVIRDCGVGTVLSDDPLTPVAGDATAVGRAARAAPTISKSFTYTDGDGDGAPSAGETLRFRLVARNEGTAAVTGVTLTDSLPACLGNQSGLVISPADGATSTSTTRQVQLASVGGTDGLQPDEEVVVEFVATVVDPVACCNQASLDWPGGSVLSSDPRSVMPPEATCLQPIARSLRLTKRVTLLDGDGDGVPTPGDRVRYDVTVGNDGAGIPDIVLTDEIPGGLVADESSIVVAAPTRPPTDFAPAPAGLHGAGRIQVSPLDLQNRATATLSFEAVIAPGTVGRVCNRAGLVVSSMTVPRLSEDEAAGGETCLTVVTPQPPGLVVTLSASGPLADACALAGEELDLTIDVGVTGSTAHGVEAAIERLAGFTVLDAGGGTETGSEVAWTFGTVSAGVPLSRTIRVLAPCGGVDASAGARATATDAPGAVAPDVTFTLQAPDVSGSLALLHDDTNGDGVLDPGETVLATLTLTELGSCDAADLLAALQLDASLVVSEYRDGGRERSPGVVEWPVNALAAGASTGLSVVLQLDPAAPACATPFVTPSADWPASPNVGCPEKLAWNGVQAPLPPGPCVPAGSDLLREDRVTDLATAAAGMSLLLNVAGDDDSCAPGSLTRIDPSQVVALDVASQLATGIVLSGDALPVGAGLRGQLVFYEVSRSCDVIRACKVDADGDPSNHAESVRIGLAPCL